MSDVIFEAGDVVTCAFFGDKEFVLMKSEVSMFPVKISINNDDRSFTINGKSNVSDTSPILKLVRKKQKERELVESFMVKNESDNFYLNVTESYESALDWIKLRGNPIYTYQIEKLYKIKE